MTKLDTTPWARQRLTDEDRRAIAVLAPEGSHVWISQNACRISLSGVVIGEAFHAATPMSAFLRAMDQVKGAAA